MQLDYDILHDRGLPMVFVGDTFHNHTLYSYFRQRRSCQNLSLEEVMQRDDAWFQQHQIMAVVTNVSFKCTLNQILGSRPTQWFSVISTNSVLHHDIRVGKNTLINNHNVFYDHCQIGDHCTITNHVMLSHKVSVDDMCHVSPFSYLCFTKLNQGVVVGLRASFIGEPRRVISVAPWTNVLMDSRVSRDITASGTYYGHRLKDPRSSLDLDPL